MGEYLQHLGLKAWPFSVVPRPEYCDFLAGRPQLRNDIDNLLHALSRRDTSSIHVLWSWLGAGKTHSLYYLANLARAINVGHAPFYLYPLYSEFPRSSRGFIDLYKSFVLALDQNMLVECFLEAATGSAGERYYAQLMVETPDLANALRNIAMGGANERALAIRWLRADTLPPSQFRAIGASQRISTTDQAIQILKSILLICSLGLRAKGREGFRLIWMLDELQRLDRASSSVIRDVNAGLHSLFNACPSGLTLVISFSGRPDQKKLPQWISPELRDRIGATKVLILPPFQKPDALAFIQEILSHFRSVNHESKFFPFSQQACTYVIDRLAKQTELRPRVLMHAMNAVLEEADSLLESGKLSLIDWEVAERILADYAIVSDGENDAVDE